MEALAIWIQDARSESSLLTPTQGLLADDKPWHQLASARRMARPPPGIKAKRLLQDGQELAARESRLLEVWTKKLIKELRACEAPVLEKLTLSLDTERASELLAGSTRPNTLKRYVGIYKLWRMYQAEATSGFASGLGGLSAIYRKDEPCGRSVPGTITKAIRWMEAMAEFPDLDCASHGRLAWAAKDKIVEALSEGAPPTQRVATQRSC